jgi:hypothetical protein
MSSISARVRFIFGILGWGSLKKALRFHSRDGGKARHVGNRLFLLWRDEVAGSTPSFGNDLAFFDVGSGDAARQEQEQEREHRGRARTSAQNHSQPSSLCLPCKGAIRKASLLPSADAANEEEKIR